MAFKFKGLSTTTLTPAPIPAPRVLSNTVEDDNLLKSTIRIESAKMAQVDERLETPLPDTRELDTLNEEEIREARKFTQLVDNDFPFDDSQVAAIDGIVYHLFEEHGSGACLTGAAGTGKTTTEKAIVERLMDAGELNQVDLETYWRADSAEPDEDGDIPTRWVPSVALVGFTGRSTQMIKKNFPRDWHGNIMTIHRCLGFVPEYYEEFDDELGEMRNKRRFVPTYTADNKLPWDIIVIDEAGMVGLDLWEQLRAALKPTCKVVMIGDINQLPPVHGRSVFGFAMDKWPSWELTVVHRQEGKDNPIVDNAWRVLKGQMPQSGGAFQLIKFDGLASKASQQVRKFLPQITEKGIYDPIRDTTITPINGNDGSRGFALGQLPLNREFAIIFNSDSEHPRYIIDAGRERQKFAVGDKVMATRNDYEAGITNGMTGVITSIHENGAYTGDRRRFGTVEAVNAWMAQNDDEIEDDEVDLDELSDSFDRVHAGQKEKREKKERGPASHVVTVRFGHGEHSFEIPFATLAEVASLMTAYVVTCHKMQGGESPVVVIILHDAHKAMLYREWLYTAITRASQKCFVLYTEQALRTALAKQRIAGSTLAQKIAAFNKLSEEGLLGAAVRVNLSWKPGLPTLPTQEKEKAPTSEPTPIESPEVVEVHHHHYHEVHTESHRTEYVVVTPVQAEPKAPVDGGELKPQPKAESTLAQWNKVIEANAERAQLPAPAPVRLKPQVGAYRMWQKLTDESSKLLLAPPKSPFKMDDDELLACLVGPQPETPKPQPKLNPWLKAIQKGSK